jgi:hypothetical protein
VSSRKRWLIGAASLLVVAAVAITVLLSARSDEQVEAIAPPATTTTTGAPTTTVSPVASPLTGMPVEGAIAERPALVIKIDNAEGLARPQAGINQADVVIEEKVEGNISRFFAVFQSTDAASVGPVRSARSTDVHLVGSFNRPLFAYSGANATFLSLVRAAPLVDVGYDAASGDYERRDDRRAPHNLFTSSAALWARTPDGSGPPPPFAEFSPPLSTAPAGTYPASSVGFSFGGGGARVEYRWDGGPDLAWRRWQNGTEHVDTDAVQVSARNVIIQFVDYVNSGARDSVGNPVPEAQTVGTGEALVFTDGVVTGGGWSRPTETDMPRYVDGAGQPIVLRPGRTWVALVPVGTPVDIG